MIKRAQVRKLAYGGKKYFLSGDFRPQVFISAQRPNRKNDDKLCTEQNISDLEEEKSPKSH